MRVDAPSLADGWRRASGADLMGNETVRVASITKMFVATATLRLVDQRRLRLDDPIGPLLPPEFTDALQSDGYDLARINIRMLLAHTSGLFDYAEHPDYQARIMAEPGKVWTRAEQLAFAMDNGAPLAAPGERFAYSDTGYILLGAILETVTGQPMATAVRDLVGFDRLGLRHTWFESLEPTPLNAPPRARQRIAGLAVEAIHPSADLFGGGGLVSTTADLARFLAALLGGEVLRPDTLAQMTHPTPQSLRSGQTLYGLGIGVREVGHARCFGHGGFWGVVAWCCPTPGVTAVGFVTDTEGKGTLADVHQSVLEIATRPEVADEFQPDAKHQQDTHAANH